MPKAIVRQEVEKLTGVSRTWYEYTWEKDAWASILVVEVDFDTDPNAYNDFRPPALEDIASTVIDTLENKTTARRLLHIVESRPPRRVSLKVPRGNFEAAYPVIATASSARAEPQKETAPEEPRGRKLSRKEDFGVQPKPPFMVNRPLMRSGVAGPKP